MPNDSPTPPFGSGALLSDDGVYRYELSRRWSNGPAATFIMLNPSTADATLDDPTIRKCRGFAQRWHMGAIFVVNLFALRSTDPANLKTHPKPIGSDNDDAIHDAVVRSRAIIVAWGAKGNMRNRDKEVCEILRDIGREPMCLRMTKSGFPQHPLYVPYKILPIRYKYAI
jgi:hypothetical protein